jgi:hypothetical protein
VHFELRWITRIELESELRRWIRFSCFSFRLLNNFDRRWYFYDTSTYDSVKVDGIGYRVSVIGINELVIGLLDRLDFVGFIIMALSFLNLSPRGAPAQEFCLLRLHCILP